MSRTKELEAALAWADNKITPAQRAILHAHQSDSYCQASETILAAEVRMLEADKRRLDWLDSQHAHEEYDHYICNRVILYKIEAESHEQSARDAIDKAMEDSQ